MPKIRLTLGNITGMITAAAGAIAAHEQIIKVITETTGGKLAALGGLIVLISKGIISFNHDEVPASDKVSIGPIMLQRTTLFK